MTESAQPSLVLSSGCESSGGHGSQESLDYKGHELINSDAGSEGSVRGALLLHIRQRQDALESYAATGYFAGRWNQQSSEQLHRTTLMSADI